MATYGELQEAIKRALVRDTELSSDGTAALADDTIKYYIKRAIDHYKAEALFFNRKSLEDATTTIAADSETRTAPTDFVEPITWRITQSGFTTVLRRIKYLEIEHMRVEPGQQIQQTAQFYAVEPNAGVFTFELFPKSAQSMTTKLSYIFELGALTADGSSNGWTTDGENLIRNKALFYIYSERLQDSGRAAPYQFAADEEFDMLRDRTVDNVGSGIANIDPFMSIERY